LKIRNNFYPYREKSAERVEKTGKYKENIKKKSTFTGKKEPKG